MSASNPFFGADWHLGHARCIQYCNRPFENAHEMNKTIIERWNEKVGKDDHAYFLGDSSFSSPDSTVSMLKMMNGKKFLILGNHDRRIMKKQEFLDCFESVKWYDVIYVQDKDALDGRQVIVLMHFPLLSWERSRYGSWHLHGHCHGNIQELNKKIKRMDVGVDTNNFYPYSYREIKEIMKSKTEIYDP